MGIQVNCDRCGRLIKKVKGEELKKYLKVDPVCKDCLAIEDKVGRRIATIRQQAEVDFKRMSNAYKEMVAKEIKKVVHEK